MKFRSDKLRLIGQCFHLLYKTALICAVVEQIFSRGASQVLYRTVLVVSVLEVAVLLLKSFFVELKQDVLEIANKLSAQLTLLLLILMSVVPYLVRSSSSVRISIVEEYTEDQKLLSYFVTSLVKRKTISHKLTVQLTLPLTSNLVR